MGIIADIHGNDVALRAVLKDAARLAVDSWWVLGDLVLFGSRRPPRSWSCWTVCPASACCAATPIATC
jgi:predicted phosphodiesterase